MFGMATYPECHMVRSSYTVLPAVYKVDPSSTAAYAQAHSLPCEVCSANTHDDDREGQVRSCHNRIYSVLHVVDEAICQDQQHKVLLLPVSV